MLSTAAPARPTAPRLVALAVLLAVVSSLARPLYAAADAKLEQARAELRRQLAGWQEDRHRYPAARYRYWEHQLAQALERTEGKSSADFAVPTPIGGAFREADSLWEGGDALALDIKWLEEGWNSSGVYLEDEHGRRVAECSWSDWSEKVKQTRAGTVLREWVFLIRFKGRCAKKDATLGVDDVELALPPYTFRKHGGFRIGFITKDGTRCPQVRALVESVATRVEPALYNARRELVEALGGLRKARLGNRRDKQLWSGLNRYSEHYLRKALVWMKGKKAADFRAPVPICAALRGNSTPDDRGTASLHVLWLDYDWNSAGIYVVDGENRPVAECNWSGGPTDDEAGDAIALLRSGVLPVVITEESPVRRREVPMEEVVLHLPPDVFQEQAALQVGVIAADGSRSKTLDVWIAKSVTEGIASDNPDRVGDIVDPAADSAQPAAGGTNTTCWPLPVLGEGNVPQGPQLAEEFTNSVGMEFKLIPAGEFMMGSSKEEREICTQERRLTLGWTEEEDRIVPWGETRHRVRITKPYYLGVYEVTQEQYKRVMGENPSWFSESGGGRNAVGGKNASRFPVESVYWWDAIEFCQRLSTMEVRTYRLPTEAEWEYACRAGTQTPFSFGSVLNGREANCDGTRPYGTDTKGVALQRTTEVGSYRANPWGLYDMHGNVWEWCADWYSSDYLETSPTDDPTGPSTDTCLRVARGGCWGGRASFCRSGSRLGFAPVWSNPDVGFRVVLAPPEKPPLGERNGRPRSDDDECDGRLRRTETSGIR